MNNLITVLNQFAIFHFLVLLGTNCMENRKGFKKMAPKRKKHCSKATFKNFVNF